MITTNHTASASNTPTPNTQKFKKLLSNKLNAAYLSRSDLYHGFKQPTRDSSIDASLAKTFLTSSSSQIEGRLSPCESRMITQLATNSLSHSSRPPSSRDYGKNSKKDNKCILKNSDQKSNNSNVTSFPEGIKLKTNPNSSIQDNKSPKIHNNMGYIRSKIENSKKVITEFSSTNNSHIHHLNDKNNNQISNNTNNNHTNNTNNTNNIPLESHPFSIYSSPFCTPSSPSQQFFLPAVQHESKYILQSPSARLKFLTPISKRDYNIDKHHDEKEETINKTQQLDYSHLRHLEVSPNKQQFRFMQRQNSLQIILQLQEKQIQADSQGKIALNSTKTALESSDKTNEITRDNSPPIQKRNNQRIYKHTDKLNRRQFDSYLANLSANYDVSLGRSNSGKTNISIRNKNQIQFQQTPPTPRADSINNKELVSNSSDSSFQTQSKNPKIRSKKVPSLTNNLPVSSSTTLNFAEDSIFPALNSPNTLDASAIINKPNKQEDMINSRKLNTNRQSLITKIFTKSKGSIISQNQSPKGNLALQRDSILNSRQPVQMRESDRKTNGTFLEESIYVMNQDKQEQSQSQATQQQSQLLQSLIPKQSEKMTQKKHQSRQKDDYLELQLKLEELETAFITLISNLLELKTLYNSDLQLLHTIRKIPGFNDLIRTILLTNGTHAGEFRPQLTIISSKQGVLEYLYDNLLLPRPPPPPSVPASMKSISLIPPAQQVETQFNEIPLNMLSDIFKSMIYFTRNVHTLLQQKRADHQKKQADDIKNEIHQISVKTQKQVQILDQKVPAKPQSIEEFHYVQQNLAHILDRKNYMKQQPFISEIEQHEEGFGHFRKVLEVTRVQSKQLNELNDILRDFHKYI